MRIRFVARVAFACLLLSALLVRAAAPATQPTTQPAKPIVQLAILLDTSSSMNGLIDQAKTQLWKIVNEFARSSRDGVRPEIQVAIYHYGTPSLGKENGFIKQLAPLTADLDKISEELFKLKTRGGLEYCGWVIKNATADLAWSTDKTAYKAIFICGNEPFTQGPVDFKEAVKAAVTKGIVVNTIYCGNHEHGIREFWKEGATLGDGAYLSINMNQQIAAVAAPQDRPLAELNGKLNDTYIPFGTKGREGAARQAAQDANAAQAAPGVVAERALAKASGSYRNEGWDLADAVEKKSVKLDELKKEELPAELRDLDAGARAEYVEKKRAARAEIQKQIAELSAARAQFLAVKSKEQSGDKTLETAIIEAVRKQATSAGLKFAQP